MNIDTLISKGLRIGEDVFINFGCIIDESFCWLIDIGSRVTLAPNVHILAHDASTKRELGYTKIGLVKIGNDVFIGAGTIILPGVSIGNKCVIGAGSLVTKNIPDNSVAVGNPAIVIDTYDNYMKKNHKMIVNSRIFDASYTEKGKVTEAKKNEIRQYLKQEGRGYIV